MKEARAIAERYGIEAHLFDIDHAEASALINKGDHATAQARLEAMERRLSPTRRMQWPFFHHIRSVLKQRLGEAAASAQDAERAVTIARETGLPSIQMPHFLSRLAQARATLGDWDGAMAAVDEAISLASSAERRAFEQRRELLRVEAAMARGDDASARAGLATVLGEYRERGEYVFIRSRPDLAAQFANYALRHDIETGFVLALIERNALAAPADACQAWPFRLRIHALGGFELVRDGQPMRSTGKAQQRPLDLLKLLVAMGGKDADIAQLSAALWPDADGAAAKNSFDSTLFRLRKMLDVDNALVLTSGKLSLPPMLAWTDVRAFESALEAAERASEDGSQDSAQRAARRLLAAYRGPLLGSEDAPWIAKPRDALRARFVRALLRLGAAFEGRSDWAGAIEVYGQGLEADNLAESLHRGLMRALYAQGDRAEALNVYRRCRELLSIVLGIKPSAETERLHRQIAGN
jgi:DNA-binding SARP family transcriptional activator